VVAISTLLVRRGVVAAKLLFPHTRVLFAIKTLHYDPISIQYTQYVK
jgi:hypothetical protein